MAKKNPMTVTNVGAPRLQPLGNVTSQSPASFGGLMKVYREGQASKNKFLTRSSQFPNFVPGYTGVTGKVLTGEWQCMTNLTAPDRKKLESLVRKYGPNEVINESGKIKRGL